MKTTKVIAASLTALAGMSLISNAYAASFDDYATVTSLTPAYREVNQRQNVCEDVQVYNQGSGGSTTGTVIGGIAGGLLGNQVGGGNGRTAATAIGAVVGAMTGNNLGASNNGGVSTRQQCHVVNNVVNEQAGYTVTYEYAGRTFTSRMAHDPGPSMRVSVAVVPR